MLAITYELPAGVINVLVDFVLKVNKGKLTRNYIEQIAVTFKRRGIKTVPDAMEELKKAHKKTEKKTTTTVTSSKSVSAVPSWINMEIKTKKISEEKLRQLEEDFKEFR